MQSPAAKRGEVVVDEHPPLEGRGANRAWRKPPFTPRLGVGAEELVLVDCCSIDKRSERYMPITCITFMDPGPGNQVQGGLLVRTVQYVELFLLDVERCELLAFGLGLSSPTLDMTCKRQQHICCSKNALKPLREPPL